MSQVRQTRIGELLVKAKLIDDLQLRSALSQHHIWGGRLAHVVAELGFADEDQVVDALAAALGVKRVHLGTAPRDSAALAKFDAEYCERVGVFPIALKDGGKALFLAMADPTDLETIDEVGRKSRSRVIVQIAAEREIKIAIGRHFRNLSPEEAEARLPRRAGKSSLPEQDAFADEDEFKIVDMSGKTLVKRLADIDPALAASLEQQKAQAAAPTAPRIPTPPPVASAADLLDELTGGGRPQQRALTPEELERLRSVHVNQQKAGKILRAVMELLTEKAVVRASELQARIK